MIRRAEEQDIPFIMNIYNDAVMHTTATFDLETKSLDEMKKWYDKHQENHFIMVSEEEGKIAAYASFSTYREKAAFDGSVEFSIYVHNEYQNMGIGKKLTRKMIREARESKEIHSIISLITYDNEVSIKMHQAFGFRYCGRMEDAGFKFGKYLHLDAYQLII